jgi:glycosyltransferase involved in cell wall biosynthesis
MKVFDTRWIGPHGIGRFADEVYRRLGGYEPITMSGRPSRAFDPFALTAYLHYTKPQSFFSPGYNVPVGTPCSFVFCIHDLNHLHFDREFSVLKRSYYEWLVKPAAHRADAVLTVSDFSRDAIREWCDIPQELIVNVGNGISDHFAPDGPSFPVGRPYFVNVGAHRPHKNFERTLRAYAESRINRDTALVSTAIPSTPIRRLARELGIEQDVMFMGPVSDETLASLYRGSIALIFASLYEGFGLPIAEAMACGTAVITSNVTAMPEVAGDSAVLVDPRDTAAIADAMRRVYSDEQLRRELRSRGLARASKFSWDQTAQKITAALRIRG